MQRQRRRNRLLLFCLYYKYTFYEEKRWWVRPIFKNKIEQGYYANLIEEMRLSDTESYFNYMRMTQTMFDELLDLVGSRLTKQILVRELISPGQKLAVTLRYLAAGESISTLAYGYRLGKTTVSNIIIETTCTIRETLHGKVFITLNEDNWRKIAQDFYK